jgi:putative transposase
MRAEAGFAAGPSGRRAIKPVLRHLDDVKLVISDAHEGTKAAVAKVLHASWQRCRVHFMRNVPAHAGRQGRRVVSAFIGTAFVQDDADTARTQWRQVADQLRPKVKKLAAIPYGS